MLDLNGHSLHVRDLGFYTDGADDVSPEEPVTTYIFTGTNPESGSWTSSTLNSDVEQEGRRHFY